MTIIKHRKSLKYYPHNNIQSEAVEWLLSEVTMKNNYVQPVMLIKMFEAFCDLTCNEVSYVSLQHPDFANIAHGFIGALFSGEMLELKADGLMYYSDTFYTGAGKINQHIIRDKRFEQGAVKRRHFLRENKSIFIEKWADIKKSISSERLSYWCGFSVEGRKGRVTYLELQGVYQEISQDFAKSMHKLIAENALKRSIPRATDYNKFFRFLVENKNTYNESTFQDSRKIDVLFKSYCREFFLTELKAKKRNKHTVISEWNEFSGLITETFLESGIWKIPISGKLPHIVNEGTNAKETNIKRDNDGIEVKRKLLTDVPTQVTDQEALELLFGDISTDLNVIKSWAIAQSKDLYQRQLRRKNWALKGRSFTSIKKDFGNVAPKDDELICHLAATFEERGHTKDFDFRFQQRMNVTDVMHQLGLPQNSYDLDPYKVLLTSEHPEITPDYLRDLELYDKRGNLIGFVEIDGVYWLTGYKDRKTPDHSEQQIQLTEYTAQLVKEVIEITEPVRRALKSEDNDLCRFLFVNFSGGMKKKTKASNITYNKSQRDRNVAAYSRFRDELKEFTDKRGENLDRFIWRVSLTTIRASAAVLVYLDTHSIQEMSKALGHTNVIKDKLREYLPEPILAFFQSRWVRIFQKAIICEAMKDSEYLLEATKFEKMDDLHQFLTNHALKNIPKSFMDDNVDNDNKMIAKSKIDDDSRVYFSVDKGILVTLMSLESAVKSLPNNKTISGYAKYWSKVSELITAEIERSNNRDLKSKLSKAKPHINPESMEHLIYATTS
ncbi:ClbS/DfsB family four-helix bundle protein [Agarivorans albus]